jgi:hypothetical protein
VPRGGARPGAGRKRGGLSKKTTEVAARAAEQGVTPLEVLLEAMRRHYDAGELDRAAAFAKDAAPYMHPRLSTMQFARDSAPLVLQIVEEVVDGHGGARSGGTENGEAPPGAASLPTV